MKSDSAYNLPMAQPVQTFRLGPKGVERMELPAATLAQASLQLPQGTYTTLRTYEGEKFLRLEAHLSRLEESSRLLGRPIRLDRDCIRCALREVLACFAVKEGVLHTAGEGVLEGITRSIVLEEAAQILPIRLEPVRLADLPSLSEAFITSASREVVPVVSVDGVPIGRGQPGPIARDLLDRYRQRVRQEIAPP